MKDSYVLVAGFAQLPKGTPVYELQKSIGCILVVDLESDMVVKATFTFIQPLTNEFVSSLITGHSLREIDSIVKSIEERFIVPPQKAVIQALLSARKIYAERKYSAEKESACN
jgi:hypothetical protein